MARADDLYSETQVADARRLNRFVEDDWADRLSRGLPPDGRAEQAWRSERLQRKGGLIDG